MPNLNTLSIRIGASSTLHRSAEEVADGTDNRLLIGLMYATMYSNKGISLAAPQVGESLRVFVMHVNNFKQEFINPVILKRYGGKVSSKEGCLSFPGLSVTKLRYKQIIIIGFDKDWKPIKRKLKGLSAICAQHELDHLNGITIADKEEV